MVLKLNSPMAILGSELRSEKQRRSEYDEDE